MRQAQRDEVKSAVLAMFDKQIAAGEKPKIRNGLVMARDWGLTEREVRTARTAALRELAARGTPIDQRELDQASRASENAENQAALEQSIRSTIKNQPSAESPAGTQSFPSPQPAAAAIDQETPIGQATQPESASATDLAGASSIGEVAAPPADVATLPEPVDLPTGPWRASRGGAAVAEYSTEGVRVDAKNSSDNGFGIYITEDDATSQHYAEKSSGAVHVLDIKAPKETLLNRDRPISEQSQYVRSKLAAAGLLDGNEAATGAQLYEKLVPKTGISLSRSTGANNRKVASEALLAMGIRGMSYQADHIGGTNKSAQHYVLFDGKDIQNTSPVTEPASNTDTLPVVDQKAKVRDALIGRLEERQRKGILTDRQKNELPRLLAARQAASSPVMAAASEAATSPVNDRPDPTPAQREAGNFKVGRTKLAGLDVSIEYPAGVARKEGQNTLQRAYGYFRGTVAKDKDHLDVFLGERADDATLPVFVIDQKNADGTYDEAKVIMGEDSPEAAKAAYLSNYPDGWDGIGGIRKFSQASFKRWATDPKKTTRPVAMKAAPSAATPSQASVPADPTGRAAAEALGAAGTMDPAAASQTPPPIASRDTPAPSLASESPGTQAGAAAAIAQPSEVPTGASPVAAATQLASEDAQQTPESLAQGSVSSAQATPEGAAEEGPRIYPTKIRNGETVRTMWAVESPENRARREAGERTLGGDALYETEAEARTGADFAVKQERDRVARVAEIDRQQAKAGERKAATAGKTLAEIKAADYLAKPIRDSATGDTVTRAEWVARRVASGAEPSTEMVDKVKPMSRMAAHRATNEQQRAHDKKVKDGGKVPEYLLGNTVVTKTEYDHAVTLKAAQTEAQPDRRADADTRAAIDQLPGDERDVEIQRLRAQVAELEQKGRTDSLTGLPNKRAFDADEELGWPTVSAIDMDGLKRLNSAIGHEAADRVLRVLGETLGAKAGTGVRFYRRSGDEFAARFERKDGAAELMAELQSELDGMQISVEGITQAGESVAYDYNGIGISFGLGANYEIADAAAERNKAERLEAGLRDSPREDGAPGRLRPAAAAEVQAGEREGEGAQAETVTLYHGGGRDLNEIKGGSGPGNVFGGIFTSRSRESAASHGDAVYTVQVRTDKIADNTALEAAGAPELGAALRKAMPRLEDADFDTAYQAVVADQSDRVPDDDLMRVFREDTVGEASWEAQRIRGAVAKALGFDAVEMADEHGTSILVLPGTQVTPERAADEVAEPTAKDSLTVAPPATEITDVGAKIGGARKDMWTARNMDVSELANLNDRELVEFVKKDAVFKRPDYAAIAAANDRAFAYTVKMIYDAIPNPADKMTREQFGQYVEAVAGVRAALDKAQEAKSFANLLPAAFGADILTGGGNYGGRLNYEAKGIGAVRMMGNKLLRTLQVGRSITLAAERKLAALPNWPGKADAKTASTGKQRLAIEKPEKLASVVRTGNDYRNGKDATAEQFRETFGFRGVEFGNWTDQGDRQAALNHAYDAMMDLADALAIPPKAVSLNGQLGMAFGARGKGAAAAHYEPALAVINLTKTGGAGSAAHEWAHAVDDYFGKLSKSPQISGRTWSAIDVVSAGRALKGELRPELLTAMNGVMRAINTRARTADEAAENANKSINQALRNIAYYGKAFKTVVGDKADQKFDQLLASAIASGKRDAEWAEATRYGDELRPRASKSDAADNFGKSLVNHDTAQQRLWNALNKPDTDFGRVETELVTKSRQLGDYWVRPHELFARSFESFIKDKIDGSANRSDYLVHPAKKDRGTTLATWPYPAGSERKSINEAMQAFVDQLKTRETDRGIELFDSEPSLPAGPTATAAQVAAVQRVVDLNKKGWGKNAPEIEVLDSPSKLPILARRNPRHVTARGYYDGTTAYLVAPNLTTPQLATATLAHEVVGHYGLDNILDQHVKGGWARLTKDIAALRDGTGGSESIRAVIADTKRRYPAASDSLFAKEFMAVLAEQGVRNTFMDRWVAAARVFLRDLMPNLKFSDAELRQLLVKSDQYLRADQSEDVLNMVEPGFSAPNGSPFNTMTREEFLGKPKITSPANADQLRPRALSSVAAAPAEPFIGGMTARYSPDGAAVFEGEKLVASYNFGNTLVVAKSHRRDGVATELVYQWRSRYPAPATTDARTKAAQAVQEAVWRRIEAERNARFATNDQANTPAFRKWFEGSEVVDAAGEPLVMYHGTTKTFDEFLSSNRRGKARDHYFSDDPAGASEYAGYAPFGKVRDGAQVLPVYLALKKPLTFDARGENFGSLPASIFDADLVARIDDRDLLKRTYENVRVTLSDVAKAARAAGYDGVIASNLRDGAGFHGNTRPARVAIAFDPTQVKSATGNVGTFDATNPDIRYSTNDQTKTPAFAKWFGKSRVVDAKGEPLVVYHGTPFGEFTEFDGNRAHRNYNTNQSSAGFFFTNTKGEAQAYANGYDNAHTLREREGYEPTVIPAFLSIQKPKMVAGLYTKVDVEKLKAEGYDGINFYERNGDGEFWVAFNPEQIKSATGNTGAFDPANPDIRYSVPAVDEYQGEHAPADPESGAPMHNVTGNGIYPADVYSAQGRGYYGTGDEKMDSEVHGLIARMRWAPNGSLTVYRAVPKSVTGPIRAGDWVTPIRAYAVDHGRGALNGDYKVQQLQVRPRDLFTDGNSWLEWGYHPQPPVGRVALDAMRADPSGKFSLPEDRGAWAEALPRAGDAVDGLTVRDSIPNRASIAATVPDATTLPGVRAVPLSSFDYDPGKPTQRVLDLAAQIKESGEISPLIVGVDAEGPYIIEGSHRIEALIHLKHKAFPALVVVEPDAGGNFSQAADPAPTFYSALSRSVATGKGSPKAANATAWKQWLDGRQRNGEFKGDERAWLGVDAWLDSQNGNVTKQQLADFIAANEVAISETVLRGEDDPAVAGRYQELEAREANGTLTEAEEAEISTLRWEGVSDDDTENAGWAKFQKYTLPGGENYREVLLTLNRNDGVATAIADDGTLENFALRPGQPTAVRGQDYRSSHFDQSNILAHLRTNDRTDADGNRVFFVEEVQSDWHQAGRKNGYAGDRQPTRADLRADLDAALTREDMLGFDTLSEARRGVLSTTDWDVSPETRALFEAYRAAPISAEKMVPNAPLKTSWPVTAMKRAIRHAAENGFDKVAWTPGQVQADRFDLSKQVKSIAWNSPDGKIAVAIIPNAGRAIDLFVDGSGAITGGEYAGKRLDEVVGKGVADEIMGKPSGRLSGDGLKVGGEGMRGFYDKILPAEMNKYLKQWGAKVGTTTIMADGKPVTAHSITITPQMRDSVMQGQPLFSMPAQSVDALTEVTSKPDESAYQRAKGWVNGKWRDFQPTALGALQLRHLLEIGEPLHPGMKGYADLNQQMQAERNQLLERVGVFADVWRNWANESGLAGIAGRVKPEAKATNDLMHDATLLGLDPSKPYTSVTFLDSRENPQPFNRKAIAERIREIRGQVRGRSGDDKTAMFDQIKYLKALPAIEAKRLREYPDLVARWQALGNSSDRLYTVNLRGKVVGAYATQKQADAAAEEMDSSTVQAEPAPQAVFKAARDYYEQHSINVEDALIDRVKALDVPETAKRGLIDRLRVQFETQRLAGVYFPLQRFGDYWLSFKTGEAEQGFAMFETFKEFEEASKRLKGMGYSIDASGRKDSNYQAKDAPSGTFVAEIMSQLKKAGAPEKIQDDIYQLYLKSMPEMSMRKHSIHRKGTSGYSGDALRAFGKNGFHGSHQLSKLRYSHLLTSTLDALQVAADQRRKDGNLEPAESAAADALLGELRRRHDWILSPKDSTLANMASSIGFLYYLGATPAAAVVNLLQGASVTFPALGARYGFAKAARVLAAATKDSMRTWGNINKTLTTVEEQFAYKILQARGDIEKTQAHSLAGIAEGDQLRTNPTYAKVMNGVGYLFGRMEIINREAAGMAAFRLARAGGDGIKPMTVDAAIQYASDIINGTHFDYSNANRARFMQGNVAKVLLQFRSYSLSMSWFLGRNAYLMFKGESPEVKRLARRTIGGVLGMSALFSGAMGLPMMGVAATVAGALQSAFGDDDEPWDFKTEFRAFLATHLGADAARIVADGVVNPLGADVAGRVGMSDLWFRDADRELEGRDAYFHALEQIAGPMGGIAKNLLVGKQQIGEGQVWRGVETMLPKFAKDAMKSVRFANEGANTLRGDPLIEDVTSAEKLTQLLGFTPTRLREQYRENSASKNYESWILDKRQSLINAYALSMRFDDPELRTATVDRMRAYSLTYPELAITPQTIRKSMQARARYSALAEGGVVLNKRVADRVRDQVNPPAQ